MLIKCYKSIPVNGKFECFDVIGRFISNIWTKRFFDVGSFELKLINNPLKPGDIISCGQHSGIVLKILEDENSTSVYGYDLCGLLKQRYIWGKTEYSGSAENIVKSIAIEVLNTGTRTIDGLYIESILNPSGGLVENVEKICAADAVKKVCTNNNIGYDVVFTETGMTFKTLAARDKTKEIVFSSARHNIESIEYERDESTASNVVYYGEKQPESELVLQKTFFNGAEPCGIMRKESGTTSDDYVNFLKEHEPIETISGSANEKLHFGSDYILGDIVTVSYNDLCVEKQITEVQFVYEKSGNRVIPTFGITKDSLVKRLLSKEV